MSERKYSVSEIERMRDALRWILIQPGVTYYEDQKAAEIEEQLRTYMLAGTAPEELEAKQADVIRFRQELALRRQG